MRAAGKKLAVPQYWTTVGLILCAKAARNGLDRRRSNSMTRPAARSSSKVLPKQWLGDPRAAARLKPINPKGFEFTNGKRPG